MANFTQLKTMFTLKLNFAAAFFVLSLFASFAAAQDIEQLEEEAIRRAVEAAAASVIRFDTIGGNNRVEGAVVGNGPATGLIVSEDGFVISASFHFAHQPATILARLPDGSRTSAEIVGRDQTRKLVLLKLALDEKSKTAKLPTLETIPKEQIRVGETIIALGRAFGGEEPNVSTGIISAKDRVWDKAIQTDAKISPANFGGPMLNLKGELIGVLVPMSPDDDAEMAGTDWYDSGIGFAVPMSDIEKRLDELKSGKTLRKGLAGISLAGTDTYADAAVIAFCHATSPAGKAGMKAGDKIIEINGRKISRQSEMKHALGPLYESDKAIFVVQRSEQGDRTEDADAASEKQRLEFNVELVGEIVPFVPGAIGLLVNENDGGEVVVANVFKDSPAETSGIKVGLKITSINGTAVKTFDETRLAIAGAQVGDELTIETSTKEDEQTNTKTVSVAKQTASIPDHDWIKTAFKESKPTGSRITKVSPAEFSNNCFAIVPDSTPGTPAPGLLVWMPTPGKLNKDAIVKTWQSHCEAFNVVLLVPESTDEKKWDPRDFSFVVSAVDTLAQQVNFDRARVVIGGSKTGGAAASAMAFNQRDLFRGLVMIDSGLSRHAGNPKTSPVEPMMVLAGANGKRNEKQAESIAKLELAHFPLEVEQKAAGTKIESWVEDVLAWVNSVNRI